MNYDDFLALAQSRRSIRKFLRKQVPREHLTRLFEAARWAPSNHNRQPWRFIVIDDKAALQHLAQTVGQALRKKAGALPTVARHYAEELVEHGTFFADASVLIIVLHKQPASFSTALLTDARQPALVSGEPLSAAMAAQNLALAAHTLGLGTCMLTAPLVAQAALEKELQVPPGYEPTCFVAVGYPDEAPAPPRRKSLEHIVEFRETHPGMENGND
jgi:nitroreductase